MFLFGPVRTFFAIVMSGGGGARRTGRGGLRSTFMRGRFANTFLFGFLPVGTFDTFIRGG